MFAPVYGIAKGEFSKDIEIVVLTELRKRVYKVFSSYVERPNVYSIIPGLNNVSQYEQFISSAKGKSSIDYGVPVSSDSKMITLSTCDVSGRKRAIVHAVNTSSSLVPMLF